MQKITDTLKNQFNSFNLSLKKLFRNKLFYVYLISFIFVFLSLFFEKAPIYLCAYILFFICVLDKTDALAMLFFFYPFFAIFVTKKDVNLYNYMYAISVIILAIKYLIDVILKKKKIDWVLVCAVLVYMIYLILPIHKNDAGEWVNFCNLKYFASVGSFFLTVYLVFIYKDEIDFVRIFHIFMTGFLIAGVLGVFVFCSPRLQNVMDLLIYVGYNLDRYNGLFQVPNTLAIVSLVVLALTMFMHYNKKIGNIAYLYFTGAFVLGYVTMARSFLYAFIIGFVVFSILVIVRDRKNWYKTLLPYVGIMIVVALIFLKYTVVHLSRLGFSDLLNGYGDSVNKSDEELMEIVDPGRGGLIKKYAKDYLSSALVILFGRGIAHPWLGLSSHNTYLQALWNTGLVGIVLLVVLFILFLKKYSAKKSKELLKSIFTNAGLYLLLLPILAMAFVENLFMNMQMIIIVNMIILVILASLKKENSEVSENAKLTTEIKNEIEK